VLYQLSYLAPIPRYDGDQSSPEGSNWTARVF
jgi:hypothetical protein